MKYDLQVHTEVSSCSGATPKGIVDAAVAAGLDGIAITDHDSIEGVTAVQAAAPAELTVIPGVEVTTTQGHLLALDVDEPPPQDDPMTVINHIHDQGGIAILSHPFDRLREYYTDLDEIATVVDGVEVINSRCVFRRYNEHARVFANEHDIPITGGSDAHFPTEIGNAYTESDGPILEALRSGDTRVSGRGGYVRGHVLTKVRQFSELLDR
jgi:predicted metal-dependent phosphoesterase TrpH